ncbi:AraC family transcriptional regulator [Agarivorans sp. DSG3-1]|uniref:AraC family transcriptional regulator n=1 Tax=Agarivorans sp. DSG3-1 TaxID=3342249 RepID=UPI00398F8D60
MQIYNIQTDAEGRELTHHGFDDFPCAYYDERFSEFIGGEVPWHWHDEIELVQVVAGSTLLECVGGSTPLTVGDAVFVNAGTLHKMTQIGEQDCRILNFVLAPQLIGGAKNSRIYKHYVYPVITNSELPYYKFSANSPWQSRAIKELERAFAASQQKNATYELAVNLHLMRFWQLFCENQPSILASSQVSSVQQARVQALLGFIHQNYRDSISTAAMSKAANISESECYRLFSCALKSSPNQYLLHYRLQQAANQLIESSRPITEVAHNVGFNCPAYFAKRFKQAYGKTPKQFRRE